MADILEDRVAGLDRSKDVWVHFRDADALANPYRPGAVRGETAGMHTQGFQQAKSTLWLAGYTLISRPAAIAAAKAAERTRLETADGNSSFAFTKHFHAGRYVDTMARWAAGLRAGTHVLVRMPDSIDAVGAWLASAAETERVAQLVSSAVADTSADTDASTHASGAVPDPTGGLVAASGSGGSLGGLGAPEATADSDDDFVVKPPRDAPPPPPEPPPPSLPPSSSHGDDSLTLTLRHATSALASPTRAGCSDVGELPRPAPPPEPPPLSLPPSPRRPSRKRPRAAQSLQ